jgi:hypothetical protein
MKIKTSNGLYPGDYSKLEEEHRKPKEYEFSPLNPRRTYLYFDIYTFWFFREKFVVTKICDYTQWPGVRADACNSLYTSPVFPFLLMHSLARRLASLFPLLFCSSNHSHCAKESTMPRSLVSFCPPNLLKYDYSHI